MNTLTVTRWFSPPRNVNGRMEVDAMINVGKSIQTQVAVVRCRVDYIAEGVDLTSSLYCLVSATPDFRKPRRLALAKTTDKPYETVVWSSCDSALECALMLPETDCSFAMMEFAPTKSGRVLVV